MPAKSIKLSRIGCRSELAVALDVPISALDVVTLLLDFLGSLTDSASRLPISVATACMVHIFAKLHRKGCGVLLLLILALRKNLALATAACFGFPINRIRLLRLRGFWGFPPRIENGLLLIQQRRQPADACGGR